MLSLAPDYELMVQLSAPKTTSPFSYRINYADIGQVPVDVSGLIYSTTRRVVLSNQNNGQTRIINSLSIYNADTASNTITIEKNLKGKISLVLSCILNPGDTLLYSDNTNFQVINSDGKLKVTAEVGGGVGIVAQAVTVTSGNVVFSAANNVTFGLSGSTMTASIDGAGGLSAINISAGSTSNNLSALTFSNGSGVSFGLNGSVLTASVRTNYQSSGNYLTTAMASNAGSDFLNTSQSSLFQATSLMSNYQSAGNYLTTARASNDGIGLNTAATNVTWTVNSSGISLDAAGYLTTAMNSAAGSQFVNTSAALNLTNISATLASNGVSLSVAPQSAVAQNLSLYALGNTTQNSSTNLSANALSINAIGSLTVGYSNGSIQLSAPNALTTARASNDAVGLNTALTANGVAWTVNSSGLSLNIPAFLTTAAQSNQVVNSINGSTGEFSFNSGSSLSSSRNGNSITWGLATNITTALQSAGNYLTTARASNDGVGLNTAQTNVTWTVNSSGISINAAGYAGTNTAVTGSISVTLNTSGVSVSIPAFLTTAMQSASSSNFAGTGSAITNGTMTFGTSGLSLNLSNHLTTARASNDAVGLNTALTANGVSWTVNSSGLSLNVPAFLTTAMQSASSSNFAGTGSAITNGTMTFNTSGLSLNLSNHLTTAMASNAGSNFLGLNTAKTNVTWTVNSSGISIDGGGYAGTGTSATNASVTLNSNGLQISVAAPGGGGSINFSAGTTSGNLASITFGDAGGVSFGLDGGIITASAPAAAASPLNISAGTVSDNLASVIFGDLNGVSFGLGTGASSRSITASHNGITTARASTDGIGLNTAQTNVTWTVNSAGLSFDAAGYAGTGTSATNASITLDSLGLAISVGAPGGGVTFSGFNPYPDSEKVAGQVGNGTIIIDPVRFDNVVFDRLINNLNFTATSNQSGSMTVSIWNGLYTKNASTLSLLSSFSTSTNVSMSGTVGSYSLFSGIRNLSIPASMTVTQGDYWLAVVSRTTTAGAAGMTLSQQMLSNIASVFAGQFGVAQNTTMQLTLGQGVYSATSAGLPNSIGFSQIRGSDSGARRAPFVLFAYSTV